MITEAEALRALPKKGWLHDYVLYAASQVDSNLVFHIACGLAALTTTGIGQYRSGGHTTIPNGFFMLIGDSSSAQKTVAIELATKIINECDPDAIFEKVGSRQALVGYLHQRKKRLGVYEEFGLFLASAEQGQFLTMKTAMNDLYDGASVGNALAKDVREKKNLGPIKDPLFSLLVGSAPDYLERHTELVDWTGGFFARFTCFQAGPERKVGEAPNRDSTRKRLVDELSQKIVQSVDRLLTPPVCLGLTPAAKELWHLWTWQLDARQKRARFGAGISRAKGMVMRIAYLLALDYGQVLESAEWVIDVDELGPAIAIVEMHIRTVFSIGNFISESLDMKKRQAMLRAIGTEPTAWDAILRDSRLLIRDAKHVLESLQAEQMVFKSNTVSETGGGAMYYRVPFAEGEYEAPLLPPHIYNDSKVTLIHNSTEPQGLKALRLAHLQRTSGLKVVDES